MTGRDLPSAVELRANMHKRLYIPAAGRPGSRKANSKRFNRHGATALAKPVAESSEALGLLSNALRQKGHGNNGAKAYVQRSFNYMSVSQLCNCVVAPTPTPMRLLPAVVPTLAQAFLRSIWKLSRMVVLLLLANLPRTTLLASTLSM